MTLHRRSPGVRIVEPTASGGSGLVVEADWQQALPTVIDWLGLPHDSNAADLAIDVSGGSCTQGASSDPAIVAVDWGGKVVRVHSVLLLRPNGEEIGTLAFPTTSTRRIPPEGTYDDPVSIRPFASLGRPEGFHVLVADSSDVPDGCTVVLEALIDGVSHPVAWRADRFLCLGFPLLELLASELNFEPLEDGFYSRTNETHPDAVRRWLLEQIDSMCGGEGVCESGYAWPGQFSAGMTIRLDHDRPIDLDSIEDLIRFCDGAGARISSGFLIRKPDHDAARLLRDAGHELLLHTEAGTIDAFRGEVDAFMDMFGVRPCGYTAHGGRGSRGWLGQVQWEWAMDSGMLYGEMLGRRNRIPHHAVVRSGDGIACPTGLVLPGVHLSLDLGMRPEAHNLEQVKEAATSAIQAGEHVVLMNHPDIHRSELYELIEHCSDPCVWNCTFKELAERHAARYGGQPGHDRDE